MSHAYSPTDTFHAGTTTMPDDGDNGDAAAQNVPDEARADDCLYLYNRRGAYRMVQAPLVYVNDSGLTTFNSFTTASYAAPGSGGSVTVTGAHQSDIIVCRASGIAELDSTTTEYGLLKLVTSDNSGSDIPGARTALSLPANKYYPFSIEGVYIITAAGTTSPTVTIYGMVSAVGGGQNLKIQGVLSMVVEHWRPNT